MKYSPSNYIMIEFVCFVFTVYYLTMLFYKTEITLKYTQLFLGIIIITVIFLIALPVFILREYFKSILRFKRRTLK